MSDAEFEEMMIKATAFTSMLGADVPERHHADLPDQSGEENGIGTLLGHPRPAGQQENKEGSSAPCT